MLQLHEEYDQKQIKFEKGIFHQKKANLPSIPVDIINENIHNLKSFMLTLRSMTTYSFRKPQKWLPVFVLSLFLLFVLAVAFHHHEDGFSRDDCPLCVAAYHSCSVQQNDHYRHVPWTASIRIVISQKSLTYNSAHFSLTPFRSPPA
jgi:hypothetical protein